MAKVGFEGVVPSDGFGPVPNGYAGFNWSEFGALGQKFTAPFDMPGYDNVRSGKVVGFAGHDGGGDVHSSITAAGVGQTFTIKSGTFAAAWNEGESVTFTAYKANGHVKGSITVVMDQTAQVVDFDSNFKHIASFAITSSGGTDANEMDSGAGTFLAVDNLQMVLDPLERPAPHVDTALMAHHMAETMNAWHGHGSDWMLA